MIFKFQQGGAMPPFVSYTPVIIQDKRTLGTGEEESSEKSSKNTGQITEKDALGMIKEMLKGLPSDQSIAMKQIAPLFRGPLSRWDTSSSTSIASKYLKALNTLSTLEFNKDQYDKSLEIAKSKDSLNEAAITSTGYVYCVNVRDKTDFRMMRPEEIAKSKEFRPITNQDILYMRAYKPELAFNAEILGVVNSGTSMKEITNYIQTCIQGLGSNQVINNSYASVDQGKLLKGLQDFQQAAQSSGNYDASIQDLYKGKLMTKDQATQAQQALIYIYKSLPENMRALLKLRTNNGTQEEALNLVGTLVNSKTSTEQSFDLDLETPKTKDAKNSQDINKFAANPLTLMLAGFGQKNNFVIQTAAGGSNGIWIPTVQMPIQKNGSNIGIASLQEVASSDFAGSLDFSNVFMGDSQIPQSGMQNIAIDGTALYMAYLPLDVAYYNQTGKKRPDIALLGRYKQAQQEIKDKNIKNPQQINNIYNKYSLPIMYDGKGDVLNNYIRFGIINGTALDTAFADKTEFAPYLTETTDQNTINGVLNILNKGRSKEDKIKYDAKSWWDGFSPVFNDYTHVFKGTIFIPVNDDFITAATSTGDTLTIGQAQAIEARQQAAQRIKGYINPGKL